MSRGPNPDGASHVIGLARKIARLERELPRLERKASEAKAFAETAASELYESSLRLATCLDEMCSETKDFGFEGRIGWLLLQVVKQIDQESGADE